jgi:hypothetical protein
MEHVGWIPTCKCGGYKIKTIDGDRLNRKWYRQRWQERINQRWPNVKKQIVLDPFIGSGTTAIVAIKNNCDFIGIELNPDYVKLANDRILKETQNLEMSLI